MTPTADRFTSEDTDQVEVDGQLIHAAVTVELAATTTITITRRSATRTRPEGIVLASSGRLQLGATTAKRIVLWADTAPEAVEVEAPRGRLSIWNVWRDEIEQAWVGWAGIRLTHEDNGDLLLSCSDGHEPGTATDIEVTLNFDPAPNLDPVPA